MSTGKVKWFNADKDTDLLQQTLDRICLYTILKSRLPDSVHWKREQRLTSRSIQTIAEITLQT